MSNSASAIQTFTGIFYDPFNPDVSQVDIRDIAHALSNQCRYSGHTRTHWSVAAHSCLVSLLAPQPFKRKAHAHDAHEAYVLDVPRPIKKHPSMAGYRALEHANEAVVCAALNVELDMPLEVKYADNIALWAEAEELLHGCGDWTECRPEKEHEESIAYARARIREMLELDSEQLFLSTWYVLNGEDVHAHA